jgi:hypothetical protein
MQDHVVCMLDLPIHAEGHHGGSIDVGV